PAGIWQLDFATGAPFTDVSVSELGDTISLSVSDKDSPVGRLTFVGGGNYTGVPSYDTPDTDDYFEFFADSPGVFLQVTCLDHVSSCSQFNLTMDELKLIGPYDNDNDLVTDRLNTACIGDPPDTYIPCGTVNVSASSLPEPGSLALVGLGLGGLALLRRRQAKH
ncbi:MAG: PEP-CTERM sorting domain-containing protein, partial [Betaproteobacteria bacterium]